MIYTSIMDWVHHWMARSGISPPIVVELQGKQIRGNVDCMQFIWGFVVLFRLLLQKLHHTKSTRIAVPMHAYKSVTRLDSIQLT